MSNGLDLYDEFGELHPEAEWCDRCQGMGTEECLCAGDFCCCGAGDDLECRRCHGEGYFVPTAAFKAARAETAKWWDNLQKELAGKLRDSDGTATAAQCEDIAVPKDCQARAESIAQPPIGQS